MVMLEVEKKRLENALNKKLNKKELEEVLFNMGLELEEFGSTIKVDVTADRPDIVSTIGFIRALKSYLFDEKIKKLKINKSNYKVIIDKSVKKVRPRSVALVVKNLNLNDDLLKEIIWVQEKIHDTFGRKRKKVAIGIYPLDKIEFPISFEGVRNSDVKFAPLGFKEKLTREDILKKTDAGKKYGDLLKESVSPLFLDKKRQVLSMPPIINSESVGRVTTGTKDVFIECSGHDLLALNQTLNILAYLFSEMGDLYEVEIVDDTTFKSPNLEFEKRNITKNYVNNMLGTSFNSKEISALLTKMQYLVSKTNSEEVLFEVPPFRVDIWHDVDIVDDIARAYNINKLEPEYPEVFCDSSLTKTTMLKEEVRDILVGLGLAEHMSFSLTSTKYQFDYMNVKKTSYMKLGFAVDSNLNMVRVNLIPELLKCLVGNRNKEYPQDVFEVNDVVINDEKSDVLCKNSERACVLLAGVRSYTDIKGVCDDLFNQLGLKVSYKSNNSGSFIEGRCASILVNNKEVGVIGELHPKVLSNFGLIVPVVGFEIELDELF